MSSHRDELLEELRHEVRAGQRATDHVDEAVAEILGINRTDARCVDILDQHGRMTAGRLATEARLTTGAVTAVIDRLEHAGYARRIPDPSDRRRVLVELTQKLKEKIWELMGPLAQAGVPLIERYSDEQIELVLEFMRFAREVQERHAEWLRERLADA